MTYNSLAFFVFLFFFFIVYFLMPNIRLRQIIILTGNLIFYSFAGMDKLLLVIITSLVVYVFSRLMEKTYAGFEKAKPELSPKEQMTLLAKYKKSCRKYLYAALILVAGVLVYIKIGKLIHWEEVNTFKEIRGKTLLVPLGISYYTFSSVGYLLDIYWRKIRCEHNYFKLLMCITYFPHIVQGPIGHYDRLLKQFSELPGYNNRRVCFGLQLFLWGIIKKMVIADRIALFSNTVFASPGEFAGIEIALAVVLGAVQIYADFSGCMDIVSGTAQMMGISLEQNFNHPFFSKSAAEFWRRWHITLGVWFKDYIYMPIATAPRFMSASVKIRKRLGIRAGQAFGMIFPLMIVWLLTGLWHGTGKDYIVWGLYWGGLIIFSGIFAPEIKKLNAVLHVQTDSFGFRLFQMIRTFGLFCIGRMFTVTGGLRGCITLWGSLFKEHRLWTLFDGSLFTHGLDQKNFYVVMFGILLMWLVSVLQEKSKLREEIAAFPLPLRWMIYYGAIVFVLIFGIYGGTYNASSFLYTGF